MRLRSVGAALASLLAAGCEPSAPEVRPGTLTGRVVSPAGAEGAALVEIEGPGVGAVRPAEGWLLSGPTGGGTRVVVVSPDGGPLSFRVEVADVNTPPMARVLEVAGPDDALRPSLAGYRVEFSR